MPTRSPRRVEQLFFLLRQKSTVLFFEILERRCSLSKKITKFSHCISPLVPAHCPFCSFYFWRRQLFTFVLLSLTNSKFPLMSHFSTILTLGTISTVHFHHLSNLAICVTRVHVLGDFCHITCLSNPFYGTRYPVLRKM